MTDYKRFIKFLYRYKIPYEIGLKPGFEKITNSDIINVGKNKYYFKEKNFEKCLIKI